MRYSHPAAAKKSAAAEAYFIVNGLSPLNTTNDTITVSAFRVVVTATAATAPKCFMSNVYDHAPR